MKAALISDTHWGVRNNSLVFLELMKYYYNEILFPYLLKNGIKVLFHCGDLVENRTVMNYRSLRYMKSYFFDKLVEYDIDLHIIPGNHDIFYRDDIEINAVQELYSNHPKVHLYNKPTEIEVDGSKFLMVPWITSKNSESCLRAIKESKADYCLGHFEIAGAKMYMKSVSEHGLKPSLFDHFKKVYSGHFHHPSRLGKVQYISALFHTTWQCFGDDRGFIVLNLEDGVDQYVKNTHSLFQRIYYDDSKGFEIPEIDDLKRELDGSILELVVTNKSDHELYNRFRSVLNNVSLVDLVVVDRYLIQPVDPDHAKKVMKAAQQDDPVDTLCKFTAEYSKADKTVLREEITSLYEEAVNFMAQGE